MARCRSDAISEHHKDLKGDESDNTNSQDTTVTSAVGAAMSNTSLLHVMERHAARVAAPRMRHGAEGHRGPVLHGKRPRTHHVPGDSAEACTAVQMPARGRRKQHCPVRSAD
jgi:hypothetical protein